MAGVSNTEEVKPSVVTGSAAELSPVYVGVTRASEVNVLTEMTVTEVYESTWVEAGPVAAGSPEEASVGISVVESE